MAESKAAIIHACGSAVKVVRIACVALAMLAVTTRESAALQGLTGIQAEYDSITGAAKTNDDYNSTGAGPTFPTTTGYRNTFNVGTNNNLRITGFDINTNNYLFIQLANNINLQRVNNPVVTGAEHIILYEQYSTITGTNLEQKGSFQPTMEATLLSDSVNRGADNVFCNQGNGDGNNNNIERIDYVFSDGYPAYNALNLRGFLVMDRGGNDALRIAAITNVTASGVATGWAQKVQIATTNWGLSGIVIDTIVFRGYDTNRPSSDVGGAVNQNLTGVFITWAELGVATNQLIYGYSLTANDVTNTDWNMTTNFPLATDENANNGGLDLMSGGAMFFDSRISARIGDLVWDDYNGDGIQDPGEPGLSNILVKVYDEYTNLAAVARTGSNGTYLVSGLTESNYFVRFFLPTNETYEFSPSHVGGDDAIDSDADTNTGSGEVFFLAQSTTNREQDAGMHRPPTDLGIFKSVNNTNPNVLNSIIYTIRLTNNGPYSASLITVTDAVPSLLTYVTSTVSQGSYNPTTAVWSVGTVTNGSNATLTITATVNTNTGGSWITNTATVLGANRPDHNPSNNTSSAVLLVQWADIGVGKTVSNSNPAESNLFSYTIYVTNGGPNTASNIVVTDNLPSGITYTNHGASQGTYTNATGLWNVGLLTNGGTAFLVITARVNVGTGGSTITNTARVTGSSHEDTNSLNNTSSVPLTVQGADVIVTKTVDAAGPVEGQTIVYTIVASNAGPNTANVTVYDRLTNTLTFVTNSQSRGTYTNATGIWNIGALTNGTFETLTITATVNAGTKNTSITNTAFVFTSSLPDPVPTNNTGSVVIAVSALTIDKVANVSTTAPGSNITYTITVTNSGSTTHTNVNISDVMPPGVTFVSGSSTAWWYSIESYYVREEWDNIALNNNDGTANWLGNWVEVGEAAQDATAGDVTVTAAGGRTNTLRIDNPNNGAYRSVNLSGYTNAALSLDWSTFSLDAGESVSLLIATNGLVSQVTLMTVTGNFTTFSSTNFNITQYIGTNTTIEFLSNATADNNEGLLADDIQISFSRTITNIVAGSSVTLDSENVLDDCNSAAVNGNDGSTNWLADWTEISEADGAGAGDTRIGFTFGGRDAMQIQDNDGGGEGWSRAVNLSGYTSAVASFVFRRNALDNANDYATFDISTNNGSSWIEIDRYTGAATDGAYLSTNYDISAYISTNTLVRFLSSPNLGGGDQIYFDDIDVTFSRTLTNIYDSPPNLASNVTLAPGFVLTLTFVVTVDNPCAFTQIVNTASVTSDIQRTPVYASVTTKVLNTDLGVVKTVNNANPREGSNIVFSIVVTNNGMLNGTGVALTDLFPTSHVTYVTNTASAGSYNPTTRVWTVGNLNWSNSATLTITARVSTNTAGLTFTNTVYISAANQADGNPNNNTSSVPVTVYGVDLGVTKAVNDSTPVIGTNITFSIVVTNNGPNDATGVTFTDLLVTGLTFVSATPSAGTYTNSSGIWNIGSLAASNSATLSLVATVGSNLVNLTRTNTVSLTTVNEHDLVVTNNSASVTFTPRAYFLAVTKTSDGGGVVDPGQTVTYTIVVTNNDITAQTGVGVFDPTPTGTTYVAASTVITKPDYVTNVFLDEFDNRLYSNNDGNTNYANDWQESEGDGPLAGDTEVVFDAVRGATFTLQFQGGGAIRTLSRTANLGTYTNAVLSFDYRRDGLEAGEQVLVEVTTNAGAGAWVILDRFEGAATDGGYLSTNYDIKAYIRTNTGIRFRTTNTTMGAGDMVWFDDVKISSARRETNTFAGGAPTTLATNMNLAPGDFARVTFQVTVDSPNAYTQIVNTVAVTGTMQSVIYASVTDRVALADLKVTKSVNNAAPRQGDAITYRVTITNIGPYNTSNVVVNETLPTNVTYVNHNVTQGTWTNTTGIWTVGVLNVSSSATLTITATVNSGTAFLTITNCARVTASAKVDPVGTNNTNCVTITPIFDTPDVAVTNCAYLDTNGAVMIWHVATSNQLYDLLYVDATTFSDSLTSLWALADQRQGTILIDTGSATRTAPHNLGNSTLRFYRVSAPGYWEPTNPARYASAEVLGVGTIHMYPGFNWIRTWGIPCRNTVRELFGNQLTATNTAVNAPKSEFCDNNITQEIWHASAGTTNVWLYSFPTSLVNQSAEEIPIPLDRGMIITLPATVATQKLTMIFRVPTNTAVSIYRGASNTTPSLSLVNPNIPQTLGATQLLMPQAGFFGAPNPVLGDQLWRFDRVQQKAVDHMWYRTTDSNWVFVAGFGIVPNTYSFPYNEAIAMRRRPTNNLVWTNRFYYTPPTLNMAP